MPYGRTFAPTRHVRAMLQHIWHANQMPGQRILEVASRLKPRACQPYNTPGMLVGMPGQRLVLLSSNFGTKHDMKVVVRLAKLKIKVKTRFQA